MKEKQTNLLKLFLILKILIFYNLFFPSKIHSIHHHSRLMINLLEGTEYLWKKRVLIFNLRGQENQRMVKSLMSNLCELRNRKLLVFFKRDKKYYNFITNDIDKSLKFDFPFKITLIGIDGDLKYKSQENEELDFLFKVIDKMPMRKNSLKKDRKCE
tara:strand:+ start:307 stop:777 length:471 start_codon:yes stop_codon:yes gene_type:complete